MHISKLQLLAASTALSVFSVGAAQAQVSFGTATLHGNGASSIANILVQASNCYDGPKEPLGISDGSTITIPDFNYSSGTTAATNFDCSTTGATPRSVQPAATIEYVSTGSGGGRKNWYGFTDINVGTNPFSDAPWGHIQYAFSDAPISSSELTSYNSGAKVTGHTGPAIQVPIYVLPIAVAYAPAYGRIRTAAGTKNLVFNLKVKPADGHGGLRLTKTSYCGIFNGTITNFNDPALKADNGGQSLMDPTDSTTRWNATGVPIRLVGRLDKSGTTNLFSRHLASVCNTASAYGYAGNPDYGPTGTAFAAGNDGLPNDGSILFSTDIDINSAYTSTATTYGGLGMTLSGAYYDKSTNTINTSMGSEAPGKFMVASGSDGVSEALDYSTEPTGPVGSVSLNGKLGYVGADWIVPSVITGAIVDSADLQIGTGTTFAAATAANATAAFGTVILPPQSTSTGAYSSGVTANGMRNNPLAWVQAANNLTPGTLADPAKGYPVVGTTNALLYTCYSNLAKATQVVGFLSTEFAKLSKDSTGAAFPAKLFTDTAKASGSTIPRGINPRNGVAALPTSWITAINNTFFKANGSATTGEASLHLYIITKLPTSATAVGTYNTFQCTGTTGA